MTKELLIKFLNDQCNDEELKEVIHWVKNDSFNNSSRGWGLTEWKNYTADEVLPDNEKFSSLLDKIHHKININGSKQTIKMPITVIATWLTKAAAILLIPVLAFLVYTLSDKSSGISQYTDLTIDSLEIVAPIGSKTVVQFSDGTEVYLNHGSKIKYPQKFNSNTREVALSGEGYFKVTHNPEKPFIVRTQNLNVKALGTTFNVSAYPDEKIVATTLIEGNVVIERNEGEQIVSVRRMEPGQYVSYDIETGEVFSSKENIEKYISWKDDMLIFKRDSIAHIAKRLSRWYNVDIEIADEEAKEFTYTATFVDESLYYILDLLQDAAPITYKKLPREQLPDGTFLKQKIIINKKRT